MNSFRKIASLIIFFAALVPLCSTVAQSSPVSADKYLWLEEVEGQKAMDWVKSQDSATIGAFVNDTNYQTMQSQALTFLNAKDRIPFGSYQGGYVYNFWQDANHARGILRRTTLESYQTNDPKWETVLDIDSLNKAEGKSWVYQGSTDLPPGDTRTLIALSEGGKDAAEVREYDMNTKSFIKDGFRIPVAKSATAWLDSNTILVGTDFGPGSLTTSGYPRICKIWKRGTPLSEAKTIFEGDSTDISSSGGVNYRPEGKTVYLSRRISSWQSMTWLVDDKMDKFLIPIPNDAQIQSFFKGYVIVRLYSDWLGFHEGSLISIKISDLKSSDLKSKIAVIYQPDNRSTISGITETQDYIIVDALKNVRGKVLYFKPIESGGTTNWTGGEVALPEYGSVGVASSDPYNNLLMVTFQDFLTPTKLYLVKEPSATPLEIKSTPLKFDASNMKIEQFEAKSKDGTMVPYFMVGLKSLKLDGTNPTFVYGYGGFRISQTPTYSSSIGKMWLERGGVYVLANIRGGGEFGPEWHKAAILENRQKAYDDFIAVCEDLVQRKVTSPRHLGIMGGSNGGLLVGAVMVQRPDLLNAVVCQSPLLDMLRYTKLPPGASWVGEYGDPDSDSGRAYIFKYSPYQNLKPGVKYPQVMFMTSTRDDRVHPGHARKMAAKMEELGNKVYFYEQTEGGHSAGADNSSRAKFVALEFDYLLKMLK